LGLPATSKELRYEREADVPEKASHVALDMISFHVVSLVAFMKRFYQSWIERPKSEFK
jgi:hypothetical protein